MNRNNFSQQALTDLHTHILPAVDDGARDLDMALEMLCMQKQNGVQRVMLTPHFHPQDESAQSFLERRQKAYESLLTQWKENMPELHLGAEVRYLPQLADVDLRSLTLGQSDYLLLELSNMEVPAYLEQVLESILQQGITPILAHVERCVYFRLEPERLKRLIDLGALAQVTGRSINNNGDQHFAKACLKNGLAHIIASDLHVPSQTWCLADAIQRLDCELVERAEKFAKCVWKNQCLPTFETCAVKKCLFGYY